MSIDLNNYTFAIINFKVGHHIKKLADGFKKIWIHYLVKVKIMWGPP